MTPLNKSSYDSLDATLAMTPLAPGCPCVYQLKQRVSFYLSFDPRLIAKIFCYRYKEAKDAQKGQFAKLKQNKHNSTSIVS